MSNFGQAVLTIGGTIIGGFFGMPQLGYLLGSLAGQALFPTDLGTVKGPRINDLQMQGSTIGAPIPLVYGKFALAGNVIWSSGIIESVTKHRQGGKGGPTQTFKEYTYAVSIAVGICEGAIDEFQQISISRIWADAVLIYDTADQRENETLADYTARLEANGKLLDSMAVYDGSPDQLPDPTIESYEGVGNISAFRDLLYVVFTDFQLANYGNRIPNYRFEVVHVPLEDPRWHAANGVPTGRLLDVSAHVAANRGWDLFVGGPDVYEVDDLFHARPLPGGERLMIGDYLLGVFGGPFARMYMTQYDMTTSFDIDTASFAGKMDYLLPGSHIGGFNGGMTFDPNGETMLMTVDAGSGQLWRFDISNYNVAAGSRLSGFGNTDWPSSTPVSPRLSADGTILIVSFVGSSFRITTWPMDPNTVYDPSDIGYGTGGFDTAPLSTITTLPPFADNVYYPIPEEDFPGTGTQRSFDISPDGYHAYLGTNTGIVHMVLETPFDMTTAKRHCGLNWATPLDAMGYRGIDWDPSGYRFWAYRNADRTVEEYVLHPFPTDETRVPLATIVRDVCLRCGLDDDQIDVTDLTELVDGYAVGTQMSGRDAISPLRTFGFFDCVESSDVLKWPTRGKAVVDTFTPEQLGAHASDEGRPSTVSIARKQEVELPRRVRVHYVQSDKAYEPGEQGASRISVRSTTEQDVELAISMTDQKAAQIAEVVLYESWVSRNGYSFNVGNDKLHCEPADNVICPIDGREERIRLVKADMALSGVITIEAVRDDDGAYVSYALGAANVHSGKTGGGIAISGLSDMILMDLPLLRDEDNDAGYYAAMSAVGGTTWGGAAVFRSPDGGITFESVGVTVNQATVGALTTALPSGPTDVIDEGNTLIVTLATGELESITDDQLLFGLNAAAIGEDGRWEIIQFRDVALSVAPNTWALTGLIRGRRGTEWAVGSSQSGDRFVFLDSSVIRIPMNISAIGVEKHHRGVLSGISLEATDDVLFSGDAVALEPFSVVSVEGFRDSSDDLSISWIRRGRIGTELPGTGYDVPLSEATEAYEIDIVNPGVIVADGQEYNPYHWVRLLAGNDGQVLMQSIIDDNPDIIGFQVHRYWNEIETSPSSFDFSSLISDLNFLHARGKRLIVMFLDRSFDTDSSDGANPLPSDIASLALHYSGLTDGYVAIRWHATVVARYRALLAAFKDAIDGLASYASFDGIATQETSLGLSDAQLISSGYTPAVYGDYYINMITWYDTAFPDKRIYWYVNFITALSGVPGQPQITRVINAVKALGNMAFGGPDVWPDSSSLVSNVYPYYETHKNDVPIFAGISVESYSRTGYTMQEIYEYARDVLHANFMMATWKPPGGQDFPGEWAPIIAANPTFNDEPEWGTLAGSADVARTLYTSVQSVDYTAADQTTDFGSPQASITVRIYQMSAVVGRGYVTEATL